MTSSTETSMLYFRLDKVKFDQINLSEKAELIAKEVLIAIEGSKTIQISNEKNCLNIFWDKDGKTLILRSYDDGLITIDIQNYQLTVESHVSNDEVSTEFEEIRTLEEKIGGILNSEDGHALLVPIKRGGPVWQYVATSDKRLIEADYDKVVFSKKTKYQTIDIIHSKTCGNCLLLDGDLMIADSDLIYTLTLLGINRDVSYKDKDVLILGGGDGGTLYELLKLGENKPNFIWMAEIDEDVVRACSEHLRGVCYNALENHEGPNHKILFEDCVETLKRFERENIKMDFVINDLTEYPVCKQSTGYTYDFETCFLMMELSLKILKPNGRLFARGNCIGALDYFREWESDVRKLGATFKRYETFVPSYLEKAYVLYEIIPKQN